MLLDAARPAVLGSYSDCLDHYSAERETLFKDSAIPVEDIIDWLGGWQLVTRIRAARTARERYPSAMNRLMGLLEATTGDTLCAVLMAPLICVLSELRRARSLAICGVSAGSSGLGLGPNLDSCLATLSRRGASCATAALVVLEKPLILGRALDRNSSSCGRLRTASSSSLI